MKITQGEVVDRQTVLEVELEDPDLDPYLERGYRRLVQKVNIPGFRRGKAPRSIVEGMLGRESLLNEAMEYMVSDATDKAIKDQGIDAAGMPVFEVLDLEPVTIKATVPLQPVLDLGDYRSIRVEAEPAEVSDADVDERIEEIRKQMARWEPVERNVELDDLVTMKVLGTVEETELINEEDAVIVATADSAIPFPGFAEKIVGTALNTPVEFDLEVSEDYPDQELVGKSVHFAVTVTDLKARVLPDLDDEFAQTVGEQYETLDQLKDSIRKDIEAEAERAESEQFREKVLDELVVTADIEIPPVLLEREIEHQVEHRDQLLERLSMTLDDYYRYTGTNEDEIQEQMRERATESLSRSFALSALIEKEGLEVSEQDIDERLKEMAAEESTGGRSISNRDMKNPRIRNSVRESLLMAKSFDHLVAIAKGQLNGQSPTEPDPAEAEATQAGG